MTNEPCPICGRAVHPDDDFVPVIEEATGIQMLHHRSCFESLPEDSSIG